MTLLTKEILKDRRQFYIDKVQTPLVKALCILANRYPEPNEENVRHPNAKVWLRVWNKFVAMEDNAGRLPLFQAIKKVFIGKSIEVDPYYRDREQVILELWLEEVLNGNWKPREIGYPQDCWKNDYRGIGYEFLKAMSDYPEKRQDILKLIGEQNG